MASRCRDGGSSVSEGSSLVPQRLQAPSVASLVSLQPLPRYLTGVVVAPACPCIPEAKALFLGFVYLLDRAEEIRLLGWPADHSTTLALADMISPACRTLKSRRASMRKFFALSIASFSAASELSASTMTAK